MKIPNVGAVLDRLPNGMSRQVGKAALTTKRHSPILLFTVGTVGFAATIYMACKATLQVDEVLQQHEETQAKIAQASAIDAEYAEKKQSGELRLLKLQTAGKMLKLYAPTLTVGILSVVALTGSHIILNKRNVGLAAVATGLEKAFDEYRRRVADEFGEEKEQEIRYAVQTREVDEKLADGTTRKTQVKVRTGLGTEYSFLFDQVNSSHWRREPTENVNFLYIQEKLANQRLESRGFLFLNDVFKAIGLPMTKAGNEVGWTWDAHQKGIGNGYVSFGIMKNTEDQVERWVNGSATGVYLDFNCQGRILDIFEEAARQ